MKAGIDCGTSLVKFAWMKGDVPQLVIAPRTETAGTIARMRSDGVTAARVTGIGPRPAGLPPVTEAAGDPIADEIALQAAGARRLLADAGLPADEFLLVSIGTGTSYTFVTKDGAERHPLGNAIGGGFIAGVARLLGVHDPGYLESIGQDEAPLDILVKDVMPAADGTPQGEFVVAHFAKEAPHDGKLLWRACVSLMQTVAVTVVRDLMLFGMQRQMPKDVVFIGTTVSGFTRLRTMLGTYVPFTGMAAHFPEYGEFAAAVGALHAP